MKTPMVSFIFEKIPILDHIGRILVDVNPSRVTFGNGSILRMWVGRLEDRARGRRTRCRDGIVNEGKTTEKGKSILWYSMGPRTALVATTDRGRRRRRGGEGERVCSENWCTRHLSLRVIRSTSPVLFIIHHLSLIMMHALIIMLYCILLLLIAIAARANAYLPLIKDVESACNPLFGCNQEEDFWRDDFLRELFNQMGSDFDSMGSSGSDSYLEYPEKVKELPMEMPADYNGIDILNPNPSIRDQEYLQHSTLWSHQRFEDNKNNINKGYDRHRIQSGLKGLKDEKENPLPAYCTPPNPCPVGYTSENNCLTNFENTAAFSRDYQSAQDCMCDTEHMLECSSDSGTSNSLSSMHISNSDLSQIVEQFQEENPYFQGEKLPIAAKKGIHVIN